MDLLSVQHGQRMAIGVKTDCRPLPVLAGLASPYFTGRVKNLTNQIMTVKFFLQEIIAGGNSVITPYGSFQDIDTNTLLSNYFWNFDYSTYDDKTTLIAALKAAIVAQAVTLGYTTFTTTDIIEITDISEIIPVLPRSFNNVPSASIVTGTGATGTQISTTRDAHITYSPTMVTTASISGNASDVIVLEICSTNSATSANWIEIARVTNAQALSLAVTLQSVQTTAGILSGILPAGYYRKIRAITSGTVSNSMSSGQEVLL